MPHLFTAPDTFHDRRHLTLLADGGQRRDRPANHLMGSVPVNVLGSGIPTDNRSIECLGKDSVVGGLNDRGQPQVPLGNIVDAQEDLLNGVELAGV